MAVVALDRGVAVHREVVAQGTLAAEADADAVGEERALAQLKKKKNFLLNLTFQKLFIVLLDRLLFKWTISGLVFIFRLSN